MEEQDLFSIIGAVRGLDEAAMARARERQDRLAKPPKSLGRLEALSVQLAGITGSVHNEIKRRRIVILCADNGVVEEGVSSAPQSVTLAQTINFTRGLTGVASLARHFGDELDVVDVGINARFSCPGVLERKIAMGTKNIAREDAMTRGECVRALLTGIERAQAARAEHVDILGVGEMGIGNTTTSSAVLCALTGLAPDETVGRGGGITEESFYRKKRIVADALRERAPDADDPIDVLAKLGGFDLAAMAGVFIGAAYCRMPVVIDGFISVVAALAAARLCPACRAYMIPSHASFEQGYAHALRALQLEPMLQLDMRLGEGSGCPLAFVLVGAACAVINDMATFEEAAIDDAYLAPIRAGDQFSLPEEKAGAAR